MTSAAIIDIQDEKNELAAAAWSEVEELECRQGSYRKSERECYARAYKQNLVAQAAQDALAQNGLDSDVRADLEYIARVASATCQVWLEQSAKAAKRAEAIGSEIRAARMYAQSRERFSTSYLDFSELHDILAPMDPQERAALDFSR